MLRRGLQFGRRLLPHQRRCTPARDHLFLKAANHNHNPRRLSLFLIRPHTIAQAPSAKSALPERPGAASRTIRNALMSVPPARSAPGTWSRLKRAPTRPAPCAPPASSPTRPTTNSAPTTPWLAARPARSSLPAPPFTTATARRARRERTSPAGCGYHNSF